MLEKDLQNKTLICLKLSAHALEFLQTLVDPTIKGIH